MKQDNMLCSLLIKSTHIKIQQVRSATCVWLLKRRYFNDGTGARRVAAGTQNTFTGHIKRDFSLDVRLRDNVKSNEKVGGQGSVSRSQLEASKVSAAKKVKEAGRDFTYMIVVIVGIGVTGGLLYVVFKELLSSSSPSKIYGKALDKCRAHPEVVGAFGEPIKGYGETTRRGRRQQVSHVEYIKDGLKHMRLKFYIEGSEPRLQGTVHTEMKENPETGKYEFRYIFVDVDSYPRRTIVVEDNR